jgi:hypothetical protein
MAASWDKREGVYTGPTLNDCQKLWDTLTTEYVTDLAIKLEFQTAREPQFTPQLVCWSPGLDPDTGGPRDHVWATKQLQPGFEAITYRQLYDLLIVTHRSVDSLLGGQLPMPLP